MRACLPQPLSPWCCLSLLGHLCTSGGPYRHLGLPLCMYRYMLPRLSVRIAFLSLVAVPHTCPSSCLPVRISSLPCQFFCPSPVFPIVLTSRRCWQDEELEEDEPCVVCVTNPRDALSISCGHQVRTSRQRRNRGPFSALLRSFASKLAEYAAAAVGLPRAHQPMASPLPPPKARRPAPPEERHPLRSAS